MFRLCPHLRPYEGELEERIEQYVKYLQSVPSAGCFILSPDKKKVLLVCGYKRTSCFGPPKGKANECEEPYETACREVFEETGIDIRPYTTPSAFFRVKNVTLFVCSKQPPTHSTSATSHTLPCVCVYVLGNRLHLAYKKTSCCSQDWTTK